jgi:excisionase family DNA binding protein
MPQELYSVEQVADRLGLHVRTIRNYVRDGRLKAVGIGKLDGIAGEDLVGLTGTSVAAPGATVRTRHAEVSSIVQIDAVDRVGADRISTYVTGSLNHEHGGRLRVETVYDEDRATLKVIVLGDLKPTADLLHLLQMLSEQ